MQKFIPGYTNDIYRFEIPKQLFAYKEHIYRDIKSTNDLFQCFFLKTIAYIFI